LAAKTRFYTASANSCRFLRIHTTSGYPPKPTVKAPIRIGSKVEGNTSRKTLGWIG